MTAPEQNPFQLYKLMSAAEWRATVASGRYEGGPVDVRDGFIHFSSIDQVEETAAKHFAGVEDLMVISVDPGRLDGELRWEPSRGGALFPHLYGTFGVEAVMAAEPVERTSDGGFRFPPLGVL